MRSYPFRLLSSFPLAATVVPTLLILAISGWLGAADTAPAPETAAPAAPAPTADTGISVEQLRQQLPKVDTIVVRGEQVFWDDGKGHAFAFAPVLFTDGEPVIDTVIGRLPVSKALLNDGRTDALAALPTLIANAEKAGLKASELKLREGSMTGFHLRGATAIVLTDGVLTKSDTPAPDVSAVTERLTKAVAGLTAALDTTPTDELGRKTIADVLTKLAGTDGDEEMDILHPSFARRVARYGWLTGFFPTKSELVQEAVAAISASERFAPTTTYAGDGCILAQVQDAFGRKGWTLTTPTRSAYTCELPAPMYHWAMPKLTLVAELKVGADPLNSLALPQRAKLYNQSQLLASWTPEQGLVANANDWRKSVPARGVKGVDTNAVADFMPPHIVVTAMNGDLIALLTAGGVLTPPHDGSTREGERFIADAVKTLADAQTLDLLGEYLFTYIYDSPDPAQPWLLGNRNVKGDIHQTALQTTSSVTGGQMRGDCDDLAELYQVIAERQGRTAQVISLPQHAACAWAEKRDDGKWHVFILQTGPTIEFTDESLPEALAKGYKSFDDSEAFDPNGLGLSLRFSGENTRSSWRLSWRIFQDPEYARIMIDVQRDWHFQTYQRGISKMRKLIDSSPAEAKENANYRELSGLYSFTGQNALAAEYHQKAMDLTDDSSSRVEMSMELIQHLFAAEKKDEARAVATDVLDKQIPALKEKLGPAVLQLGMQLCATLVHHDSTDLAERALAETGVLTELSSRITRVSQWLSSDQYNADAWNGSPQLQQFRRLAQEFAGTGIALLKEAGTAKLATDPTLQGVAHAVQDWLNSVAFRSADEPDEAVVYYATAAAFYRAMLGAERFDPLVEAAALPSVDTDHTKRIGGLPQLSLDLPWIRAAVPYWNMRIAELLDKDKDSVDAKEIVRLGARMDEANAQCVKLSIEHPSLAHAYHLGSVAVALVGKDEAKLRALLRTVAQKNDKRLRDDTAQALGDPAKFLDLDWYRQVIGAWNDEVHYKDKYFWIAWRAALSKAPKHALMVAEIAAKRFADDPAFAEEYAFMQQVLLPAAATGSAAPQPAK